MRLSILVTMCLGLAGVAVAAPTVITSDNHALDSRDNDALESRNHCDFNPQKKPECVKGCGYARFKNQFLPILKDQSLVHTPPYDPFMCESLPAQVVMASVGTRCRCEFWTSHKCDGPSKLFVTEPGEYNVPAHSYKCYEKTK